MRSRLRSCDRDRRDCDRDLADRDRDLADRDRADRNRDRYLADRDRADCDLSAIYDLFWVLFEFLGMNDIMCLFGS